MTVPIFQVDAFTAEIFAGNPAAVCPLDAWREREWLQAVALENNLSETAYLVPKGDKYELRWFTPSMEVDLCGHATLASAWVVFNELRPGSERVLFETLSGELCVEAREGLLWMSFPERLATLVKRGEAGALDPRIESAMGAKATETHAVRNEAGVTNCMLVFDSETQVAALDPDVRELGRLQTNVLCTAPGTAVDFVSRYFAPGSGIDEDPVTGSAHCTTAPYWGARLNKRRMLANQISARGGQVHCELDQGRVWIGGVCAPYMKGRMY